MVFHVQNYMRETNVWMIRKMRWIFWCVFGFIPIYRNVYWDYLARRVAWKDSLSGKTEEEKQAEAVNDRADWGFHPRYEGVYDFSIKSRKQATQDHQEKMLDTPRLSMYDTRDARQGYMRHKDVEMLIMIAREHNRMPGAFNYNYPQTFYSTFPEIDQETYITIGSDAKRRVHSD